MIKVLKKPLVTEKAMNMAEDNQYVFEVDSNATKPQVKKAIEDMFEVEVKSVRTARIKGKVKKRYTRQGMQVGRTKLVKKAYVTLKEGHEIELVSGAQE